MDEQTNDRRRFLGRVLTLFGGLMATPLLSRPALARSSRRRWGYGGWGGYRGYRGGSSSRRRFYGGPGFYGGPRFYGPPVYRGYGGYGVPYGGGYGVPYGGGYGVPYGGGYGHGFYGAPYGGYGAPGFFGGGRGIYLRLNDVAPAKSAASALSLLEV